LKRVKKPIFWVTGNQYDCEDIVGQLLKKYKCSQVVSIDSSSDSIQGVLSSLLETDMFETGNKAVRLRGLPPDYTLICRYLPYISEKRILIIESPFQYQVGRRKIKASTSNLLKATKEEGAVYDFPVIVSEIKARKWTRKVSEEAAIKKDIDSDAVDLLVQLRHCNLDRIFSELKKISVYIGKRQKITVDDVRSCVLEDKQFDCWALNDALTEGNLGKSTELLESLWNERNYGVLLEPFVGSLIYRFQLLLFARQLGRSISSTNLKKELVGFRKKKKDGRGRIPKYEARALNIFGQSTPIQKAFSSRSKRNLAEILEMLYFVQNSLRLLATKLASSRLLLSNMVEAFCDKISIEDFFNRNGGREKAMLTTTL